MNGFLNVLKQSGVSSAYVVNRLKKLVYPNKIGHMGTLDPGACGVLVVAIGKATRLFDFMLEKKKLYRAVFSFGVTTETLDSYSVITEKKTFESNVCQIEAAAMSLEGKQMQMPPKYSAKNIDGQRAYDLARKGIEFTLNPKEIEVYSFSYIKQVNYNSFMFDIECSGGTYIRSLCRDLATMLGTVGYMSSLIRLECGDFKVGNSFLLDELDFEKHLVPMETALQKLPSHDYSVDLYHRISNGVGVYDPQLPHPFLLYCNGELFGLSKESANGMVKTGVYLR